MYAFISRNFIIFLYYSFLSSYSFRFHTSNSRKAIHFWYKIPISYRLDSYRTEIETIPMVYSSNSNSSTKSYNYYQKYKKAKYNPMKRQLRSTSSQELKIPVDVDIISTATTNMSYILKLAQQGSIKTAFSSFMNLHSTHEDNNFPKMLDLVDCNMVSDFYIKLHNQ